jgi:hypothetical protein
MMKQTVEEAARIEREKVIQELHVAYKMHKDPKHYIISNAAIQKYAVPLFKAGAGWQAKQSPWISVEERLPEEGQKVFVLVMCYGTPCIREEKFCRNSNLDKKGMWIHGNSIVLAWFPIPSFDDILEANKDVLQRMKEKGETK